jgi:hypothetical protein
VMAAAYKADDAATRVLVELSATSSGGNNGVFAIFAPVSVGAGNYAGRHGGTTIPSATAAGYSDPHTAVLTVQGDISADSLTLRVNGVQAATAANDQGTGNLGNHTLNIGSRNNAASLGFGGRLYGLFIANSVLGASNLALVEGWGNTRAGLPFDDLVAYGDSFMTRNHGAGTYPAQVAATLGVSVQNNAIGGQTSEQITARQGADPALVTVTDNSIPTSGAVDITSISTRFLSTPATTVVTREITGYLNGVHGTITCVESASGDASDAYTFTRTTASGGTTACPANTPFVPDLPYRTRVNLIQIGRNDVGNLQDIQDRIAAIVATLGHTRYLVIGVSNASTEPSGSAGHTNVTNLNAALASIYGPRFVDIREYAINEGLAAAGITPTAQDLTDIGNDVPPGSLRDDNLHPNGDWLELIAGQCVQAINALP